MSQFRLALVQLRVGAEKRGNLQRAKEMVLRAARDSKAQMVALPECFNSPYGTQYFREYAESIPDGETCRALSQMAQEANVYLIGGSIPERVDSTFYNTCTVFDPSGKMIAKHRKIHLFDIDIPGKMTFKESDALSPGSSLTIAETKYGKIGIGICYDMRFAELAMIMSRRGCSLLLYPGAFNMATGPLHWELLQRARAVDNQVYVAAVSPARDTAASYVAWGHSTIVNPSGQVLATTEHDEAIVVADIDLKQVETIREQIPISKQRRFDLYPDVNQDVTTRSK